MTLTFAYNTHVLFGIDCYFGQFLVVVMNTFNAQRKREKVFEL